LLLELVAEADEFYADWGTDTSASEFYTTVAKLAMATPRRGSRGARSGAVGLAARLRQSVERQGNVSTVSVLLGVSGVWSDAVVADARHAVQEQVRQFNLPRGRGRRRVPGPDTVTAVCHCIMTGEVFAGLAGGGWPGSGRATVEWCRCRGGGAGRCAH
jgi:hypothetical protein